MTISYQGGRRIQGATTDYNTVYDSSGKLTGTHTSDNTTVDGWLAANKDHIKVNGGNIKWDLARNGTNYAISYDLGANISDEKWLLRFRATWDTIAACAGNEQYIGVSDLNSTNATTANHDFLGCMISMWASNADFRNTFANGSTLNGGGGASNWSADPSRSVDTFYFVEIKRISTTTFSISFSSTDSYDGNLASSGAQTCSADTKDLRYIYFGAENAGSTECGQDCLIDNIQFYDGYTTPTTVGKVNTVHRAGTNNGTVHATWDYVLYGGSVEFDGSNDNIQFGDNTDWNFMHNGGSWTASFWMKPDNTSDRMVFNTNGTTNTNIGVQSILTSGNLRTRIGNGSGDWVTVTKSSFSVNTWYFVVITFDGTTLSVKSAVYGGSLSSATTGTVSGTASSANSLSPLTLGSASDSNTTYPFDGHLNVFMIWDRVLTSAEINTLYGGGTGSTSYATSSLSLRTCLQIAGESLKWFDNQVGIADIQVGSRFEETDTRKIYYIDDISWKELDGVEATNYRSDSMYEQLTGETP